MNVDNFFDTIEQLKPFHPIAIVSQRIHPKLTYTGILRRDGKMERMRYLTSKSQDNQQRLHLIFELTVCFVVNAAKKRLRLSSYSPRRDSNARCFNHKQPVRLLFKGAPSGLR